jgi:hypothetical protein
MVITNKLQKNMKRIFAGNGLSRTAMIFKIATLGGGKADHPSTEQDQGG